jgi:hypothetical protein
LRGHVHYESSKANDTALVVRQLKSRRSRTGVGRYHGQGIHASHPGKFRSRINYSKLTRNSGQGSWGLKVEWRLGPRLGFEGLPFNSHYSVYRRQLRKHSQLPLTLDRCFNREAISTLHFINPGLRWPRNSHGTRASYFPRRFNSRSPLNLSQGLLGFLGGEACSPLSHGGAQIVL